MTVHLFRLGDTNLHFQLGGGISQQTINLKITPCQEKPYARLPKFGFNMLAFEDWNHLKEKTMTNTHRKKKIETYRNPKPEIKTPTSRNPKPQIKTPPFLPPGTTNTSQHHS